MRFLGLLLVLIASFASFSRADDLVGTWNYSNQAIGDSITIVLNADGTGSLDDQAIRYVRNGNQLAVTLDGEQIVYTIQLSGDQMIASGGDLEGKLTFVRKGVAGQPANQAERQPAPAGNNPLDPAQPVAGAESGIVGAWTDGKGRIVFNADGTCDYVGQKMRYRYDGQTLTLSGAGGDVTMGVKVEGDSFVATVGNEVQTLSRVKKNQGGDAAAGVNGIAGVYVCQEAIVDPNNVMCITQYLTLYPDGTIGWAKSESGASRTQVTDCLERFASYQNNPQARGQTYGSWRADEQGNLQLQWSIWNNLQCRGRYDAQTGKLTVEKMGILDEGVTLSYDRQQ